MYNLSKDPLECPIVKMTESEDLDDIMVINVGV